MKLMEVLNLNELYEDEEILELMYSVIFSPSKDKIKNAIQNIYKKQQGVFYKILEDDTIKGVLGFKKIDNAKLEIVHFAIKEELKTREIVQELMKEAIEKQNVAKVTAEVNYKEMTSYKKYGFTVAELHEQGISRELFLCTYKI